MKLRLGYVPLTDAAALIVAAEMGFAAREGLAIELVREPSWATLRDRLALGYLDGAHLLAPLALAMAAGLSGKQTALAAPFALNLNGNAVTTSVALWAEMAADGPLDTLRERAAALVAVIGRRGSRKPFTLATVFPFSSHTIQLRQLLMLGGLAPEDIPPIMTVPPPLMVESLANGQVDVFCCGSPWNSVAVDAGVGCIAALGCEIVPDCPEKLLAISLDREDRGEMAALVRALQAAADWCALPGHHGEIASLLARDDHLAVSMEVIERTLAGKLLVTPARARREDVRFFVTGGASGRPDLAHERWVVDALDLAGVASPQVYRPDLYDAALMTG